MSELFNMNVKNINNYANFKLEKDNDDKIKQFRKNICQTLNKNNVTKNNKQNTDNTILFISMSTIDIGKIILLNQLFKSNYKYIIGIDNKYYKNVEEFNNDILKYSDHIINFLNIDIKKFINCPTTFLDNNILKNKYGNKIENFNGRWKNNPSKLGSLEWFNNSNYEYFWYIEDDIYCKNYNLFIDKYNNNTDDLICTINENHLPSWYYTGWRVGDICHGFDHASLYITRYSKQYSNYFFKFLKETKTTSHHEIFIPYILNYYHLIFSNLLNKHKSYLHINNGKTKTYNLYDNNILKIDGDIFHPFKIK